MRHRRIRRMVDALFILAGFGLLFYPVFANWYNRSVATHAVVQYENAGKSSSETEREQDFADAYKFNIGLKEDQSRWELSPEETDQYYKTLDITGTGVMAVLTVPKLKLTIPVYHGLSEGVLQTAAGHMEGSSFPTGEPGTHAAIAAHTGMASNRLFTGLDLLKEGDPFIVSIYGKHLEFSVIKIQETVPEDMAPLTINPEKGLVTLITCTPIGVNTERLLVTGEFNQVIEDLPVLSDDTPYPLFILLGLFLIFIPFFLLLPEKKHPCSSVRVLQKPGPWIYTVRSKKKGRFTMGYKIDNLMNNDDVERLESKGCMHSFQYKRDLSVMPHTAATAWFASQMGVHKRQLLCKIPDGGGVITQAGAMQWTLGNVNATTGVKGAGDLLGKALKGSVTGESMIKPEYTGNGILVLEPTYKHILLLDLEEWGGSIALDDGMFLACENTVKLGVERRKNVSSAVFGDMGLFNIKATGTGILAAECDCPREELVEITLQNDVLKVDGSFVVAWSAGLTFTTERSGKTLIGSAASGEGLVNVYRGTGKLWMMPVRDTPLKSLVSGD